MIPPVGEGRSNRDVFARLAAAMGFEEAFFQQSANQLIDVLLSASAPPRTKRRRAGHHDLFFRFWLCTWLKLY
jgi:hypothetical protein